ncbi:sigma-70 family RNA polymerase sigma factor [Phaeacidiphilus oryzae]|uniref:sigma-70 family RNA polymerase sigma factor n=1 Tax=Phaeacidiphilus oryzae TaxID=348818 RepID=UPI00056AD63D|nr:sigma-70 family RNA polymerase sigma factor [Phaeacidiphilus oryzae]
MTRDDDQRLLAEGFQRHRAHLRAVAYRMLGSLAEAEDAVQESWLRLSRTDSDAIENLGGWLTTVVGRVCLDMLRSRAARREEPLEAAMGPRLPDPVVLPDPGASGIGGPGASGSGSGGRGGVAGVLHGGDEAAGDPERQALLADSVGLAMLVVLDALSPAERLAFVLRDMFAVPFEEIARMLDKSPAATRQLASRARRRVQGLAPDPEALETDPQDLPRRRAVVDAFERAARKGDFEALVAVLDPAVVLHAALPQGTAVVRGAAAVAGRARLFSRTGTAVSTQRVLVNGAPGILATQEGRPYSLLAFTVDPERGLIVELDIITDPERLAGLDLSGLAGPDAGPAAHLRSRIPRT